MEKQNLRGFGTINFEKGSDRAFGRSENLGDDSFLKLSGTYTPSGVTLVSEDGTRIYEFTEAPGARQRLAKLASDDPARFRVVRLRGVVTLNSGGSNESHHTCAVWLNPGNSYGVSEIEQTETHSPF